MPARKKKGGKGQKHDHGQHDDHVVLVESSDEEVGARGAAESERRSRHSQRSNHRYERGERGSESQRMFPPSRRGRHRVSAPAALDEYNLSDGAESPSEHALYEARFSDIGTNIENRVKVAFHYAAYPNEYPRTDLEVFRQGVDPAQLNVERRLDQAMRWAFFHRDFENSERHTDYARRYFQGEQFNRDVAALQAAEDHLRQQALREQISNAVRQMQAAGLRAERVAERLERERRVEQERPQPQQGSSCWSTLSKAATYIALISGTAGVYFYRKSLGQMIGEAGGEEQTAEQAIEYAALAGLVTELVVMPTVYVGWRIKKACTRNRNNTDDPDAMERGEVVVEEHELEDLEAQRQQAEAAPDRHRRHHHRETNIDEAYRGRTRHPGVRTRRVSSAPSRSPSSESFSSAPSEDEARPVSFVASPAFRLEAARRDTAGVRSVSSGEFADDDASSLGSSNGGRSRSGSRGSNVSARAEHAVVGMQ